LATAKIQGKLVVWWHERVLEETTVLFDAELLPFGKRVELGGFHLDELPELGECQVCLETRTIDARRSRLQIQRTK
jgi:hypothetical protein